MKKNGKISKLNLQIIAVYAICLIVYSLLFLLIPFHKTAVSWISFGTTLFAIIVGCAVFELAFSKKELKSKFYGIPIFKIGGLYSLIQLLVGIIFCIFATFVELPIWICLAVYIVLFALTLIGVILTSVARNVVENTEQSTENSISAIKAIYNSLMGINISEENKQQFVQLIEDVKFSDPVSVKETENVENEIMSVIDDFKLNGGDDVAFINKISLLIKERNQICKSYKK